MGELGTPRQEKFIKLLLENLGTPRNTKSLGELALEAGYSEAMAKNPQMILESEHVKKATSDWAKMLDDKRRMAITYITEKKLEKSKAKDLAEIVDKLNKNYQLATGGETEREVVEIREIKMIKPDYGDNLEADNQTIRSVGSIED